MIDKDDIVAGVIGLILGTAIGYFYGRKRIYKQIAGISKQRMGVDRRQLPPKEREAYEQYINVKSQVI